MALRMPQRGDPSPHGWERGRAPGVGARLCPRGSSQSPRETHGGESLPSWGLRSSQTRCAGVARGVRSSRSAWFLQLPDFCGETGQSARGPCSAGLAFGGLHAATWGPKSPSELSLPLGRPSVGKCRNSVPGLGRSSSHSQSAGEEVHGSLVTVVFAACCVDIGGIRCLSRAGALQRRAAPRRDGVCQSPFSWARLCVAAWDTRPLQTCSPCGG